MRHSLGSLKDSPDNRDFLFKSIIRTVPIPPVMDYEAQMTPVKNQYERGSCVAFATCAVKEYQESKQSAKQLDFSEEFLYDNVGMPGGGAQPRVAMDFLVKTGVCLEKLWPYSVKATDQSSPPWIPWKASTHRQLYVAAAPYKAQAYTRLVSTQDMMQSLVMNGPFLLAVGWLSNWTEPKEFDKEGYPILRPNQGVEEGGHALCCVGYDQKARTFKFKNSWGTSWGKNGYAKLTFPAVMKNLNDSWASFDLTHPQVKQEKLPKK